MRDLIEFLKARLDEDEQAARAAAADGSEWRFSEGAIYPSDTMSHPGPLATHPHGDLNQAHGEHIARHDPARVLADVEAKRYMVDFWSAAYQNPQDSERFSGPDWDQVRRNAQWTLRLLALRYATHPDYDENWRP